MQIFKSAKTQSLALTLSILIIILIPSWWFICSWYETRLIKEQKQQDTVDLQLVKTALAHAMSRRIALFEGLCAFVESDPSAENLESDAPLLMSGLYRHASGIRNLALAPDGIQRIVYPLEGNETVVGHDILHDKRPHVQKDIRRALETRQIIINGPYELRQGGLALVTRKAIYDGKKLWGLAAMVIEILPILEESGFLLKSDHMALALKDRDGKIFFGNKETLQSDPLLLTVTLHDGEWELAGRPPDGWRFIILNKLRFFQITSFIIIILFSVILHLIISRHKNLLLEVDKKTRQLSEQMTKLKKSEERYRSLIETQTDLVSRFDKGGAFIFVNDNFCKFFKKTRSELIGSKWAPLPADKDIKRIADKLSTLSVDNPTVVIENRVYSGQGNIHWMQFVNIGFFDSEGKLLEIQSVGRDITESKKALFKINQQNVLLEAINKVFKEALKYNTAREVAKLCLTIAEDLTGSKFGSIAEVNTRGKFNTIALSNPGWDQCEFIESDHDYLIQDMEIRGIWGNALHSKDGMIIKNPSRHPQSVGVPEGHPPLNSFLGVPYQYENKRGIIGLANKDVDYTENDKKTIASLAMAFVEVIERKRAEEALLESEQKYRSMMESFSEPLYICSSKFKIEYMNPAMINLVGRDATGETCYSAINSSDHNCQECAFDKIGQNITVDTNIVSPLDGRNYRVTNMPVQNQKGIASMMSIYRDMTDYLEAVAAKEKAQAYLLQSQKMESIGNLAGGIAHDFNNILSSIIGFTQLALNSVKNGSVLEDNLQEVFSAGKRARDLVKQILAFARQSDELVQPIQLKETVKEVLNFIRSSIPSTILIKKNLLSDSLIMGNPTQVYQIFMNLCTNAAYAMEDEGGTLEIDLKDITVDSRNPNSNLDYGSYIEIKVSDTGTGISPQHLGSIFDPYFTTKAPGEGTGMGLAMVHGIVEGYGGKIEVHSHLGKGTIFTLYLPISKTQPGQKPLLPAELPTGTERILFVDDEAPIARMGSLSLGQLGYSVTTRTSSVEALELFRTRYNDFDLVITDMTMPGITGDLLATKLLRIRKDIPIILCTGYSRKISEAQASKIGIRAFIFKPVVQTVLAQTIRRVLDAKPN